MLQHKLRAPVSVIISPLCRGLVKAGVRANHLTVIGALGSCFSALFFFPRGQFIVGTVLVALFALLDLLDGTVARMTDEIPSKWGALLDSTVDRISDAVIVIGIAIYLDNNRNIPLVVPFLVVLLSGLVSYVRARSESLGIQCAVGVGERTERLIIILVGTFLFGIGIDGALEVSLWLVLIISTLTVFQRLAVVFRA